MTHDIIWDDVVQKSLYNQEHIENTSYVHQVSKVKMEGFQEAVVKLAYWKQRAKGKLMALGDSNTLFFFIDVLRQENQGMRLDLFKIRMGIGSLINNILEGRFKSILWICFKPMVMR